MSKIVRGVLLISQISETIELITNNLSLENNFEIIKVIGPALLYIFLELNMSMEQQIFLKTIKAVSIDEFYKFPIFLEINKNTLSVKLCCQEIYRLWGHAKELATLTVNIEQYNFKMFLYSKACWASSSNSLRWHEADMSL